MIKPATIMLDGMNDKPIALPFPFEIGEYVICDPAEWNWFRRHYEELVEKAEGGNDEQTR